VVTPAFGNGPAFCVFPRPVAGRPRLWNRLRSLNPGFDRPLTPPALVAAQAVPPVVLSRAEAILASARWTAGANFDAISAEVPAAAVAIPKRDVSTKARPSSARKASWGFLSQRKGIHGIRHTRSERVCGCFRLVAVFYGY